MSETPSGSEPVGRIYISGPMTGLPDNNNAAFNEAADRLNKAGWTVINPAALDAALDKTTKKSTPRSAYLRRDVEYLLTCEWIYMLPGWQNSPGARLEHLVAIETGMEVFYADDAEVGNPPELQASYLVRNGERQKVYGHPRRDFNRTALMWSGILGVEVTAHDVALMMAALKISRLKSTPEHADSVVDLIGYVVAYDRLKETDS